MKEYEPIINYHANLVVKKCGLEYDDVKQELRISTWHALQSWKDEENSASATSYVYRRLLFRSRTLVRSYYREIKRKERIQQNLEYYTSKEHLGLKPINLLLKKIEKEISQRKGKEAIYFKKIYGALTNQVSTTIDVNRKLVFNENIRNYCNCSRFTLNKYINNFKKCIKDVLEND